MAQRVNPLRADPFIRHDTQQRWHQNCRNAERAVNGADRRTVELERHKHIGAKCSQPTTPQAELQKRQYFKLQLKVHVIFLTSKRGMCCDNYIQGFNLMKFYQLTPRCFVTFRKKMQSPLICRLDCDANNIFLWERRGEAGKPDPLCSGKGRARR